LIPTGIKYCEQNPQRFIFRAALNYSNYQEYAPLNFPCFKNEPFKGFLLEADLRKYKNNLPIANRR
jgi:hypothetical protein